MENEKIVETNEMNAEVNEVGTEEVTTNSNSSLKTAGGAALLVLGGMAVYKFAVKPAGKFIKGKFDEAMTNRKIKKAEAKNREADKAEAIDVDVNSEEG